MTLPIRKAETTKYYHHSDDPKKNANSAGQGQKYSVIIHLFLVHFLGIREARAPGLTGHNASCCDVGVYWAASPDSLRPRFIFSDLYIQP